MGEYNYYKEELKKVDVSTEYSPTIKIKSVNGETKWLELNKESVNELISWLSENYLQSFKENDVVELTNRVGNLPTGTKGTIVYVYPTHTLFEVEFDKDNVFSVSEISLKKSV